MIDHMEVASILLQLPQLIVYRNRLPLSLVWGTKRKRSAEDNSFMRRLSLPLPAPAPAPQSSFQEIDAVAGPVVLEPEKPAGKVEVTSPSTPLSFSPSESDERRKRLKSKLSVKKKKEELLGIKKGFTITNEFLRKEIEQRRNYLMQLEAQNLSLQGRKQQLIEGKEKENLNFGELKHQDDGKLEGASAIPDLNLSVWMDFVLPFDDSKSYTKAMAAQARQRRKLICRDKNLSAITKLRISGR